MSSANDHDHYPKKKSELNPDLSKTVKGKEGKTKRNQGEGKRTMTETRPWQETRDATMVGDATCNRNGDPRCDHGRTMAGDSTMCFIVDASEGDARLPWPEVETRSEGEARRRCCSGGRRC